MIPLRSLLAEAEATLAEAGVWDPRVDAETIAAHVLDTERDGMDTAAELAEGTAARLRELVARRARRIPLGHVVGWVRFGGIKVEVGPGAFVPRPHSEPMLRWGLRAIKCRRGAVVVDLCAGTAAIALAVAHARPDAEVHAVEADADALAFARRNAAVRAAAGDTPIYVWVGDVTAPGVLADLVGRADLVLANPPYVPDDKELLPEWAVNHPARAVYAGTDGLDVTRHVIRLAGRLLRPSGAVAVEHDDDQCSAVADLLEDAGFTGITGGTDHRGAPRFVAAVKGGGVRR